MLDELAALIGRPGALALCAQWGGRQLYVPVAPGPESPLVVLLGELQAQKIAARYGGSVLALPTPPLAAARAAEARSLRGQGWTIVEIADELRLSERRIWQLLEH